MEQRGSSESFLAGGGELGARMRALDWSTTPLGDPRHWPLSLRGAVGLLLNSRYPMFVAWGPELAFLYNDGYRPIFGDKHPAALGQPFERVWADIWEDIRPLVERALAGEATWSENLQLIMQRSGFLEETYFTFSYSPVRGDDGAIAGMFCACSETTSEVLGARRWKTVRHVATSSTDARSAAEACRLAIGAIEGNPADAPFAALYLPDEDGRRMHLAAASESLAEAAKLAPSFEIREGAMHGSWPFDAIAPGRHVLRHIGPEMELPGGPWPEPASGLAVIPLARSGQDKPRGYLLQGLSPRLPFDAHYDRYLDLLAGSLASALANAEAYEAERKRAQALAELDRAKTAFFSNVSHEFRTPLTLMLGPLEDLIGSPAEELSAAQRNQLALVHRNCLRMLKLVNAMLEFSRIEAGRAGAVYQPTDLAAFTVELASAFRSACERAGLTFTVDCPPLSRPVYVDRDMWEKIVLNLLSNAFKYTLSGGIELRLAEERESVLLTVHDTGVGIPSEELPRMFERFHRVPQAEGRTHEGTGIGLALVQELARLHGGEVGVESRHGSGSRFWVRIALGTEHLDPGAIRDAVASAPGSTISSTFIEEALRWLPEIEEPASAGVLQDVGETWEAERRPRVLFADDNADMRAYVTRLLRGRCEIETVADGEAALAAVRSDPPDLVLADVMMPRLDGFGLLDALREDPDTADIPVILLSARAGEESRVEGVRAGADDYLVKPFSARELVARVETHAKTARLRREANQALRSRNAQFQTLLERAPVGIYVLDGDLRIRELNPIAAAAFGDLQGGVIGRDFDEVIRLLWQSEYADEIVQIFRDTLATGEPHFMPERSEYRIDRDATEYYEWRVDRIPLPDGSFGLVCYFRDVSSHVIARKAVEESREALREADHKKDAFLATLSHELRNPLAPLRTSLELLRMQGGVKLPERHLAVMDRQIDQLARLTDDLLDVSRITQGKLKLRKRRVELAPVLRSAAEDMKAAAAAAGHELVIALPDEPLFVDGDPLRLGQVTVNLLSNAIKYTPNGGRIELRMTRRDDAAVICVSDNGVGIPPDKLEEVFQLFGQLDHSLERGHHGLGVGLSLVRTLVEMHGGRITARSEGFGRGSEFVARLPLAAIGGTAVHSEASDGAVPPSSLGFRVLVVDDNRDGAEALAALVRMLGSETCTAHDGLEALAAAEEFRPHLALLDIGLPGMNGYDLAKQIRAAPWGRDMFLAAVTGWAQEADREQARIAGFDRHLTKPLTLEGLRDVLGSIPR